MDNTFVEQYRYLETNHWWFTVRKKIILQSLHRTLAVTSGPPRDILNVGAAGGASSVWLASLGNVTSLENDPRFLAVLQQQHLPVAEGSITNIPYDANRFSLVCAFDVIEHVRDDAAALSELIRVCKPGGTVIITVPAFDALWGSHDEVNAHYRRYRMGAVKKLLEQLPVTVSYHTYFNSLLFFPVLILRRWARLFRKKGSPPTPDFNYFKQHKVVDRLMGWIFSRELFLLRRMRLPFGVSLLVAFQKAEPTEPVHQ